MNKRNIKLKLGHTNNMSRLRLGDFEKYVMASLVDYGLCLDDYLTGAFSTYFIIF